MLQFCPCKLHLLVSCAPWGCKNNRARIMRAAPKSELLIPGSDHVVACACRTTLAHAHGSASAMRLNGIALCQ